MCDIVARQQRTQKKSPGTECPVVKADLLVREAQTARSRIGFEEQRHDLHHEALAQTIEDDESEVVPDMLFLEEGPDDLFQARKAIPQRMPFGSAAPGGKRPDMVDAQQDEQAAKNGKHHRPRTYVGVECCCTHGAEAFVEKTCEPHQAARGDQFRKVVERPLPADILRLILRREFRHVDAVGRDVVRGAAERNDGKDGDRNGEERR